MVPVADRTSRAIFRRNSCPPASGSFNGQRTRISTPPSAKLPKESAARSPEPLDGTANAGGNARRCGFPGCANPKCEGECRAGRVQRSRSLDPQGYGGGNSRNRDERENDSGNTRRHGEADGFACISPEIADAGPGAP